MSQRREKKEFVLILASKPEEVTKVEKFMQEVCSAIHMNDEKLYKLLVATTEAVNNSILHGNQRDPKKKVSMKCETDDGTLIIHIQDEGPGFDVDNLPDPLAEENLLREHGRGVFLIRSLMDSVDFLKHPEGAEVVMKIKIDA